MYIKYFFINVNFFYAYFELNKKRDFYQNDFLKKNDKIELTYIEFPLVG